MELEHHRLKGAKPFLERSAGCLFCTENFGFDVGEGLLFAETHT